MPEIIPATPAVNAAPQAGQASSPLAVDGTAKPLELEHTFTDFDDVERVFTYHFRKPSRPQLARVQNSMRKDTLLSLRTLCLDCVVASEKDRLQADMDQFDGLCSAFGNEILVRVGFGELGK